MIGLDTNVLVRYFTQDDAKQAVLAERCINERCTADQPCRIDPVVLCELVWVLESAYGYPRQPIADVVEMMLHTRQFFIPERPLVQAALLGYRTGSADFVDELIG